MQYLTEYQTFQSKTELNDAVNEHLTRHRYDLTDTDRDILQMISRYAVKYPGVAHLKNDTIAQAIDKSKRTVQRSIRKLERLGIIERLPFKRKISGGYGANVYRVISPVSPREQASEPCQSTDKPAKMENEPSTFFKQNTNLVNTYATQPQPSHYGRFRRLLESTIGTDNRLLYRLYGVYKAQTAPLFRTEYNDKATVEAIGIRALHAAIYATKRMKIRNLAGYYSGVLDRMLDRWQSEELYA
ncbi:helix-turn-helix domain-containing protein [Weizmannia agrestimuris]|uniref:helix-turn-helix domain-containing protein n=1 Tax=Weizmannia agrestimuris TaxID=2941342 RepID=UPI00203A9CB7|nr:helix-turn-helix domain-containing protein [Weizmannia agrestimuris]